MFERRYVVIVDVSGVFLSADWPDEALECHIQFEGDMVEMLCQIRPEYQKLIQYTKMKGGGMRKVLVCKITKAIYET